MLRTKLSLAWSVKKVDEETYLINERAETEPFCCFFEWNMNINLDILKVIIALHNIFLVFSRVAYVSCQASKEQLGRIFEN